MICDATVNIRIICPLGVDSLVEVHQHCVLLRDLTIKDALHVAVCSQRLLDMSSSSILGSQLNRFEPVNVLSVEKHKPHSTDSFMNLVHKYLRRYLRSLFYLTLKG